MSYPELYWAALIALVVMILVGALGGKLMGKPKSPRDSWFRWEAWQRRRPQL